MIFSLFFCQEKAPGRGRWYALPDVMRSFGAPSVFRVFESDRFALVSQLFGSDSRFSRHLIACQVKLPELQTVV